MVMPRNLISFFCLSVKCVDASLHALLWHNIAPRRATFCRRKINNTTSGEKFQYVYQSESPEAFLLLTELFLPV